MNDFEIEKIKRFVSDKVMGDTIRKVLTMAFLKPQKNRDIYTLAASRIALDLLDEAWKELNKFSESQKDVQKELGNVGL